MINIFFIFAFYDLSFKSLFSDGRYLNLSFESRSVYTKRNPKIGFGVVWV